MRHSIRQVASCVLAVASLLLLASGCELFIPSNKTINFSASAKVETKAYYGEDIGTMQRIVWENNDVVRIVSDWAKTDNGAHYADYTVTHTRDAGASSYGTISAENGLCWNPENRDYYQFWSFYPLNGTSAHFDASGLSASLPEAKYLMVAFTTAAYGDDDISLEYYPAFTAFKITINSDSPDVAVTGCTLSSSSTPLSGSFSADITRYGVDNVRLNGTSPNASPVFTEGSTFTFFCLPTDLTDVTVRCTYTKNGTSNTRSLKLASGGQPISFTACHQHRMTLTINSQGNLEYTVGQLELIRCCFDYTGHNGDNQGTRNKTIDQIRELLRTNETARAAVANWFATCTNLNSFTEIQQNLAEEDFKAFASLNSVSLSLDQNRRVEVDMEDLSSLSSAYIQHGYKIVVKNCQNLSSLSLPNTVNNQITTFEFEDCPSLRNYNHDANAGMADFTFTNMSSLTSVSFGNSVHTLTFDNCPDLERVNVSNGNGNIRTFTLKDTPMFKDASFNNVNGTVAVTLDNCSNGVSSATINFYNNANATVSRSNSPNVTVKADGRVIN